MSTFAIVMSVAAGLILLVTVAVFNRLVALNRRCDQAAADIDVQVRQRHDLVPNLVETVKGYAGHERGTLEAVINARAAAVAAPSAGAEAALGGAIGRLLVIAESYPDLKASASFAELQAELGDLENKIAAARRYLNSAINEYNVSRDQFPNNIVADVFGFLIREQVVIAKDVRAAMETAPAVRF